MILKTKLLGHVYEFKSVKDALAKANEEKSGDRLAGIAAENAEERVAADGTPREVFQRVEELKAVGLTVPETTELLWQLRQAGVDVPLDALSDEECAQALFDLLQTRA